MAVMQGTADGAPTPRVSGAGEHLQHSGVSDTSLWHRYYQVIRANSLDKYALRTMLFLREHYNRVSFNVLYRSGPAYQRVANLTKDCEHVSQSYVPRQFTKEPPHQSPMTV